MLMELSVKHFEAQPYAWRKQWEWLLAGFKAQLWYCKLHVRQQSKKQNAK